jgi:hypothetical protein
MPEVAENVSAGRRANGRISRVVIVFVISISFPVIATPPIAPIEGRAVDDSRQQPDASVNSATRPAMSFWHTPRVRLLLDSATDLV